MDGIVPQVRHCDKVRLLKRLHVCSDGKLKTRYLIVVNVLHGRSPEDTAQAVGVARSTVYRVLERFRDDGEAGLVDRREENGGHKLDDDYLAVLYEVVASRPQDHGWRRPTWTREMLVKTLRQKTGVTIDVATMSRALKQIGGAAGPSETHRPLSVVPSGPKQAVA